MDYIYLAVVFICLLHSAVDLLLICISWFKTYVKSPSRLVHDPVQGYRQTWAFRINLLSQSSGKRIWVALKNYCLNSPLCFFTISTRFTTTLLGLCCLFILYHATVLGAFAQLPKTAVSFVMNVSPHGTSRIPLEEFSWNLIFGDFSKICWENSSPINVWQK
jgi:hypothetical protein